MPTLTDEAAEALCGGLHKSDFQFLGETMPSTWWLVGETPKQLKVEVRRDIDRVKCNLSWHNITAPPRIIRTNLTLTVSTLQPRDKVEQATAQVLQQILAIYLDVLRSVGYAGPEYLKRMGPADDSRWHG